MMKKLLFIAALFSGAQFATAQSEVVIINSEEYDELKANGELEEGVQYQMEESLSEEENHPNVYDADTQGTADRDATCDCWVEPDNTYTTLNLCDDCSSSAIFLPFSFCLYGNNYNSLYINANGNVTFGNPFGTFTPSGFPMGTAMVAPFWADVNLTVAGEIRYKITEDAIYINWMDASYYGSTNPNQSNTFQVVLTNGENDFVGQDRNVSFCYKDMQWTTGTASSGSGGFGGTAATVGANEGDNNNYIQFGRFSQNNENYDGPFGADDGINFLDDQSFIFSACSDFSNNVPPVPAGLGNCDTLYICQGETVEFSTQFLAPEQNQDVTITFDDGGVSGFTDIVTENGTIGTFSGSFTGSPDNVGTVDVTITATDDGAPAASTTVVITIIVSEISIPPLEITGDTSFCGGGMGTLAATPGFDEYLWSVSGCEGDSCVVSNEGTYSVTGILNGCDATTSVDVIEENYFLPPVSVANQPICSNDSTLVTSVNEYAFYSWGNYLDYPGTIYSDDPTQQTVYLSSGTFILEVETESGCVGQRIFNISSTDATIPEDDISGVYCNGPEEIEFFGAYSEAESGSINLFLISNNGPGWQGGSIDVFIDGELVGNYTLTTTSIANFSIPIDYGQYLEIIYNSGGDDAGNIFNFTNCGGGPFFPQPGIVLEDLTSDIIYSDYSGCASEPALGSWSISGPDYEIIENDEEDNDFDIVFNPLDYGVYNLCFTDSACGISYCYDVQFSEEPTIDLEESVLVCDEDNYSLEATINDPAGDAEIEWGSGETSESITVTESGTYCLNATNVCAEVESCSEVVFDVTPDPMLSDTVFCGDGGVLLDPTDEDGFSYVWEGGSADGSTASEVVATIADTYSVTVISACGEATASADISIFPGVNPQIYSDGPTTICDGTSVDLEVTGDIDGDIAWSTGENDVTVITANESGEYCVTVSNECESAEDCINITIAEEPFIEITTQDFILCAGDPQTIQTTSSGTFGAYFWTASYSNTPLSETGDSFTVYSDDIPQDDLGSPVTYSVFITGACGTASDSIYVTPVLCEVTIPNIISPNGDNRNEGFEIIGIDYFSSVQMLIYDRWGKEIYSNSSYKNSDPWRAEDHSEGTYYYILRLPNNEEFSGYITVVR